MTVNNHTVVLVGNHFITINNFRRELVERLLKEKYRVIVMIPCIPEADSLRELGCELIDIPVDRRGTNPLKDSKLFFKYAKSLRKCKPDVVLTYTIKCNIYAGMACRLQRIPYLCTITGMGKAIENGGLLQKVTMLMYRVALKRIQNVFLQNENDKKFFLQQRIAGGRYIMVKGSGVNLNKFTYQQFPEESAPIKFLFVARIEKLKGIDEFIEAAKYITKKYPGTEFQILGFWQEDYQSVVDKLIQEGIVIYHGMQEDVRPYLKESQCLIHPSYTEGMSNACLEAAACGRAIIASDIPGCRECLEDNVTGFLFPPADGKELIAKIEKFIALSYNEKKQMGELGRRKMENEFSRERVVDAYMEEIYRIQNQGKGGK